MWPSQLAVTMTWPQECVLALWQEVLRNLYWDLRKVDDGATELDGSCSSGHVAAPLGIDSAKNVLLRVKLPDGNWCKLSPPRESSAWQYDVDSCKLWISSETCCRKEGMLRAREIDLFAGEAFHGIATDTSLQKKRSYDHMVFKRLVTGAIWFA